MENYSFRAVTNLSYAEALDKSKEALKHEGFGVLTEIDVTETLEQKIHADLGRHYMILGACNPQLAHEAISAELELGLLLPCNVIVYESEEGTVVSAINPEQAMGMINNPHLTKIAREAGTRLSRVVNTVKMEH